MFITQSCICSIFHVHYSVMHMFSRPCSQLSHVYVQSSIPKIQSNLPCHVQYIALHLSSLPYQLLCHASVQSCIPTIPSYKLYICLIMPPICPILHTTLLCHNYIWPIFHTQSSMSSICPILHTTLLCHNYIWPFFHTQSCTPSICPIFHTTVLCHNFIWPIFHTQSFISSICPIFHTSVLCHNYMWPIFHTQHECERYCHTLLHLLSLSIMCKGHMNIAIQRLNIPSPASNCSLT